MESMEDDEIVDVDFEPEYEIFEGLTTLITYIFGGIGWLFLIGGLVYAIRGMWNDQHLLRHSLYQPMITGMFLILFARLTRAIVIIHERMKRNAAETKFLDRVALVSMAETASNSRRKRKKRR